MHSLALLALLPFLATATARPRPMPFLHLRDDQAPMQPTTLFSLDPDVTAAITASPTAWSTAAMAELAYPSATHSATGTSWSPVLLFAPSTTPAPSSAASTSSGAADAPLSTDIPSSTDVPMSTDTPSSTEVPTSASPSSMDSPTSTGLPSSTPGPSTDDSTTRFASLTYTSYSIPATSLPTSTLSTTTSPSPPSSATASATAANATQSAQAQDVSVQSESDDDDGSQDDAVKPKKIRYKQCESAGTVTKITVLPCEGGKGTIDDPCQFHAGSNYTITLDYVSPVNSSAPRDNLIARDRSVSSEGGESYPYSGQTFDACRYTSCPVKANSSATYTYEFAILNSRFDQLTFNTTDGLGGDSMFCASFPVTFMPAMAGRSFVPRLPFGAWAAGNRSRSRVATGTKAFGEAALADGRKRGRA